LYVHVVTKVLVTGMSGTGKSSALRVLGSRGHDVVDTDTEEWSRWTNDELGRPDWIWREDAMTSLLSAPRDASLFVAGCKTNQGDFYTYFDHVVLLHAPLDVLLERLAHRDDNPYGKSDDDRNEIRHYVETVVPRLRAGATNEIDASLPLSHVVTQLESLLD
jgi:shikimate kinase